MKTGGNPTLATTMMVAPGWVPASLMSRALAQGLDGATRRSSCLDEVWCAAEPKLRRRHQQWCHPR